MLPYVLLLVSALALAFAARVALGMLRERAAYRERLESAIRPAHGRPIQWEAPARAYDRPGSN